MHINSVHGVGMTAYKSVRLLPETHELARDLSANLEVTLDVAIRRAVVAYASLMAKEVKR